MSLVMVRQSRPGICFAGAVSTAGAHAHRCRPATSVTPRGEPVVDGLQRTLM
jgi:hypothetical protein